MAKLEAVLRAHKLRETLVRAACELVKAHTGPSQSESSLDPGRRRVLEQYFLFVNLGGVETELELVAAIQQANLA